MVLDQRPYGPQTAEALYKNARRRGKIRGVGLVALNVLILVHYVHEQEENALKFLATGPCHTLGEQWLRNSFLLAACVCDGRGKWVT